MDQQHQSYYFSKRFLCWDEQNRLQGVMDDNSLSVYQYDANGERTYKLTGDYTRQNISGTWHHFYQLDNATLYASPYLVVTPKGYTKHYYAESERVASKLGKGGLQELDHLVVAEHLVGDKFVANTEHAEKVVYECLHAEDARPSAPLSYLYELIGTSNEPEDERYWYHPDHLGSSSWITYSNGEAIQHLHYLPYGEDLVNQQLTVTGALFTFSAKEKDAETGYSYFGARYYNSELSIWLSVDPMSDKFPNESPYVYCSNAPLIFKDPNGREKINALSPSENRAAFNPIRRYTRNRGVIHFWGHGTESSVQAYDQESDANRSYNHSNITDFGEFLKKKSYIYNTNNQGEESKTSILVLHSCKTGVEGGIGQDLSKNLDLLVIAPSDDVEMKTLKDGSPKEKVSNGGVWNIYYRGELMESFNGETKPLFDNAQSTIEKYENMYKERHPDGIDSLTE